MRSTGASSVATSDFTVRLQRSTYAEADAYLALWRIDDDMIYGAAFEDCEQARLRSLDVEERGFPLNLAEQIVGMCEQNHDDPREAVFYNRRLDGRLAYLLCWALNKILVSCT